MMTAHDIVQGLGGKNGIACCPAHDDNHPSLSVGTGSDGKILIRCHAGCSQENVLDALKRLGLWQEQSNSATISKKSTSQIAHEIWMRSISMGSPQAALARKYLSNRGLHIERFPSSLRFSPSLDYFESGVRVGAYPAIICQVVNSEGEPQAIQRIYLAEEGTKAPVKDPKMSLGPIKGNAIHFGEPIEELAVAEGPETALAVFQATAIPTWSTISAMGMENLIIPANLKRVHIFVDLDQSGTGQRAAEVLAFKLHKEGKTVFIHLPPFPTPEDSKGIDWLDVLNVHGTDVFKNSLATQKSWMPSSASLQINSGRKMELIRLDDLFKKPEEDVQWLVEGLFPMRGFSMLAAKPKVGKTTFARCLALAIANGSPFLNRETHQGRVIYLALEEKESEVKKHFQAMGANGSEDILLYISSAPKEALEEVCRMAVELKPALIIIDTLFRMIRVRDANDYALMTNALEPLVDLARKSGCHVLCVHHLGKGERSDGDAILGSTAIFGSVDTALLLNRTEKYRTLKSIQRYGEELEESVLEFDQETRTLSLGSSKEDVEQNRIALEILHFVGKQAEPQLTASILEGVEGRKQVKLRALKHLTESGQLLKLGVGGKIDPFRYAIATSGFVVPTQDRELGNQKSKTATSSQNYSEDLGSQRVNDAACSSQEDLFKPDEVII